MLAQKVASIKKSVANFNMLLAAYRWKLKLFKPKIVVFYENQHFIIKSVENAHELEQALNLRYEVFYREVLNKRARLQIDVDGFDFICDHLIIIDKKTENVIGTYRFISSTYSDRFYSETEFDIDNIKMAKGNKLELGRACVHRDFRTGAVINLLWRGVSEYMKKVESKYLFGCSSIHTTNVFDIALVYNYFKTLNYSPDELRVYPNDEYRLRHFDRYLNGISDTEGKEDKIRNLIPTLLKGYIRMGSKVCGEPALDFKFRCADFFTILDLEQLNLSFVKKYKTRESLEP
jgi:putative hemolysin